MKQEKINDIKKGLECCSMLMDNTKTAEEKDNACNECPYRENYRCSWCLDKDALDYINELESENNDYYKRCIILRRENEQLKTLVSSLEKKEREFGIEIANLKDVNEALTNDLINTECNLQNFVKDNEHLLDRIAELEKTRVLCDGTNLEYTEEDVESEKGCNECINNHLKQFAKRLKEKLFDLGNIVNDNDIDETLKEFVEL